MKANAKPPAVTTLAAIALITAFCIETRNQELL
jgi:hypothetical protein